MMKFTRDGSGDGFECFDRAGWRSASLLLSHEFFHTLQRPFGKW